MVNAWVAASYIPREKIMKTDRDRVLALAAIFQSAMLVDQIAKTGMADADAIETSIYSIFQTDADNVETVFHDVSHLKTGLDCLLTQMLEQDADRIDVTRYVLQMMHLAAKLVKKNDKVSAIIEGIDLAKSRAESFSITHTNILAQLADLYVDNISNLSGKIMVNGEPLHLNNPENVHKIRALLLAGVRAAWLWHQSGGKRRHMVFSRKKIHDAAKRILETH
jgi:high frequency lysogenization protein